MNISKITALGLTAFALISAEDARADSAVDANGDGRQDILWHNTTDGTISAWLLDGAGQTIRDQYLDWGCDASSGCSRDWKAVGTGDFDRDGRGDLLWYNRGTGALSVWLLNGARVLGTQELTWNCGTDCAANWKFAGVGDVNNDGKVDVLWHNVTSGEISVWLLDGNVVTRDPRLSWRCDLASGCARDWRPIGTGDFNYDGKADLLWHNASTGDISAWLLDGETVVRDQYLTWKCDTASGCARDWRAVGTGDFNSDRRADILWHNASTGALSAWLLDGPTVTRDLTLSGSCDVASGCARNWRTVGAID